MKKVKVILPIILPILLVMGILAVSVYADKPDSPPGLSKPVLITVSGDISGTGSDDANVDIEFSNTFGAEAGKKVANPDGPLRVYGTRKGPRSLRYYYCGHPDHVDSDPSDPEGHICENPSHDPPHPGGEDPPPPSEYKSLWISGGALEGRKETEQIRFPVSSEWVIHRKVNLPDGKFAGVEIGRGYLQTEVIYKIEKLH